MYPNLDLRYFHILKSSISILCNLFEIGIQLQLQSNVQFHYFVPAALSSSLQHNLCVIPKYTHRLHLLTYSVLIK